MKTLLLILSLLATPAHAPADPAAAKAVPVTVTGWRFFSGPPPAGWADPGFDDKGWGGPGPAPFVPARPGLLESETPGTRYPLAKGQPLLLRAHIQAAEPERATRVRVLDLHVAYGDGFIAFLDGHEVARRGMAPSGTTAQWPHGPEVERVSVPLPTGLPAGGSTVALAVFPWPLRNTTLPNAPSAAVEVSAASGVRIVRGPYLNARPTGKGALDVVVRWQTDLPARARLTLQRVGLKGEHELAVAATTDRSATFEGLTPGARYAYELQVEGEAGDRAEAGGHFHTLPSAPAPVRFAVYGDMRYPGHEAHRAVVQGLVKEEPPIVFNTGDLTDLGSEESNWQKYFEITAPLGAIAPIVPALGNHDGERRGAGALLTAGLFGLPTPNLWTSFDVSGVHFVLLSTNQMTNMAQRDWLRDDLARARSNHVRAIFAFCHEGPWSHGIHGDSDVMKRVYAPILAAAHVDVLFSGHDHIYERGVGTTPDGKLNYVVTGGGGAPLYPTSCRAASGPPPADARAVRLCPSNVLAITQTYHYIMVEVAKSGITMCPKHPDGTAVEACIHLPAR